MKYTPKLPSNNVNVSNEHPLREFAILVFSAGVIMLITFVFLGLMVDRAVEYLTPEMERVIFGTVQAATQPDDAEIVFPEKTAQIKSLLAQLKPCMFGETYADYPIQLDVTDSEQMNAFALPGGRIIMLSGLLDRLETENGLAFVLAHELAHFTNRDHLRGLGRSVVLVTASAFFTGASSELTSILTPAIQFSSAHYSQSRESLADAAALKGLNCHYGHVGGATEFFEKILAEDGQTDLAFVHYFSSHPEVKARIEHIKSLAQENGYGFSDTKPWAWEASQ